MARALFVDRRVQTFTRSYYAALIGLQAMFVCFLFCGKAPYTAADTNRLTDLGALLYRPERELAIYLIGVIGTVLLSAAIERWSSSNVQRHVAASRSAWKCLTATAAAAAFVTLCTVMPAQSAAPDRWSLVGMAVMLGFMALLWSAVLWLNTSVATPAWLTKMWHANVQQPARVSAQDAPNRPGVADLAILALLAALIYIPNTAGLAGWDFCLERLHHWDYFVMGPAIGCLHGGSLGSEIYSQYGVGFPFVAALLARWVPLTYANLLRFAVMIGFLYFGALYAFLRGLLRSWKWACAGVLLAVDLQLFHGVDPHVVLWQFPSSTIMRSPFDICVFAALLMDTRSANRIPLILASLLAGIAVLFETDTGIYLAVTLACYAALTRWISGQPDWRRVGTDIMAVVLPGAAAAALGLEIAGRGHAASRAFLEGWLEVFRLYPSGIGMLPITMSATGIVLSFTFILAYLAVASYHVNAWQRGAISRRGALMAGVAVYGLCYLCQFIGRSHPHNLFHSCIPFVILIVVFIKAAVGLSVDALPVRRPRLVKSHAFPLILAGCILLHVASLSGFRDYPNVFHPRIDGIAGSATGVTLAGAGVRAPDAMRPLSATFGMVALDARRLSEGRKSVFFLVNNDPIYYLASGAKSHFRYSPLFQCLLTRSLQADFERQFVRERIDYVFMEHLNQAGPNGNTAWDVRESLRRIVKASYRLDHRSGLFEVWRHL